MTAPQNTVIQTRYWYEGRPVARAAALELAPDASEALLDRICGGRVPCGELDMLIQASNRRAQEARRLADEALHRERWRKEEIKMALRDKPHTMDGQLLLFRLAGGDLVVGTLRSYLDKVYTMTDAVVEFSGAERRIRMAEMQVNEKHVALVCVDQGACRHFMGGRNAPTSAS